MPTALPSLTQRDLQPEMMDDPDLARERHEAALRGLERINRASGTAASLWRRLREQASAHAQPLRVLDVATGAGDVPRELKRLAQRDGVALDVSACDCSPVAIAHARQHSDDGVHYFVADALAEPLPDVDVVTCCLFLHHLDEADAVRLLTRLAACARRVIVDDLNRTRWGYVLAWWGTRVLSRSDVVHADGPQSVRAAFSLEEVRSLLDRAGMANAEVARRWPCRFTLDWRRP
jgi:ubiquinone/menaquinone biosynthesis C-methylase UbiE